MRAAPIAAHSDDTQRRRILTKATLQAAENLGVSSRELAEILRVSPASISRIKRNGRAIGDSPGEREFALMFLRLYRSLDSVLGDDLDLCRKWFRAQNVHLGGIPSNLIKTIPGLTDVVRYLDAMRGKA
jgi:hypothetical protein